MVASLEEQKDFLRGWAKSLDVQLDDTLSTENQFEVLATRHRDWVVGDSQWCVHWEQCFGQAYALAKANPAEDPAVEELAATAAALSINPDKSQKEDSAINELAAATNALSIKPNEGKKEDPAIDELAAATTALALKSKKGRRKKKKSKRRKAEKGQTPTGKDNNNGDVDNNGDLNNGVPLTNNNNNNNNNDNNELKLPNSEIELSKNKAKRNAADAINAYFDQHYGTNFTKLDVWQQLCIDIGIEPESSITKCKQALKKEYVNIYDFLEQPRPVKRFNSYRALYRYTWPSRVYPLKKAKEDGFIKVFLKGMSFP